MKAIYWLIILVLMTACTSPLTGNYETNNDNYDFFMKEVYSLSNKTITFTNYECKPQTVLFEESTTNLYYTAVGAILEYPTFNGEILITFDDLIYVNEINFEYTINVFGEYTESRVDYSIILLSLDGTVVEEGLVSSINIKYNVSFFYGRSGYCNFSINDIKY